MAIFFVAIAVLVSASATSACDFMVDASRGASLSAAREEVRAQLNSTSGKLERDIIVCIDGVHVVAPREPFRLDTHDASAGPGRVVWRGTSLGAGMSGGMQVTSWVPTSLGGADAFVAPVPAAYPSETSVRQLWVGGVRAVRTRADVATLGKITRWAAGGDVGFTIPALPLSWSKNSTRSIEFTWASVIANWIQPRCTIASIDMSTKNVTLANPCGYDADNREAGRGVRLPPPVEIEAAPVFPLLPGGFYHDMDGGRLFYALRPDQTAEDLVTNAWIAAQDVLVDVTNPSGHVFSGLTFSFSGWWQPNSPRGFVDQQSAVFNGGEPPGAVRVSGSRNIDFVACNFSNHGAPYALGGFEKERVRQNATEEHCILPLLFCRDCQLVKFLRSLGLHIQRPQRWLRQAWLR